MHDLIDTYFRWKHRLGLWMVEHPIITITVLLVLAALGWSWVLT